MTVTEVSAAVQLAFREELHERPATRISVPVPADLLDEPIVMTGDDDAAWAGLMDMLSEREKMPTLRGEIVVRDIAA